MDQGALTRIVGSIPSRQGLGRAQWNCGAATITACRFKAWLQLAAAIPVGREVFKMGAKLPVGAALS